MHNSQGAAHAVEFYHQITEAIDCDEPFSALLRSSIDVLKAAIRLYGPEGVVLSFNGGKDACVVLHLLRAVHGWYCKAYPSIDPDHEPRLRAIYFESNSDFSEVSQFVKETCERFSIEMRSFKCGYVEGLTRYITETAQNPSSHLAFVLGTRTDDPNGGGQNPFEPSSSWLSEGWSPSKGKTADSNQDTDKPRCPPFMRVNPILHWSYNDTWNFIRRFEIPYCCLYDQGYTSLGSNRDTRPNPALFRQDTGTYDPAYSLVDGGKERDGRE